MKSGIFTDLIGGMNSGLSNGSLDLGKLMSAVQGMVGQLNEPGDKGDNQTDNTLNMITSLMGNMSNGDSGTGGQPDLASLMQGMMKGLGSPQPTNLEIINE